MHPYTMLTFSLVCVFFFIRVRIFFARFQLLDALNHTYVKECKAFLQTMGLTEQDFGDILDLAHETMRNDAEQERNQIMAL